MGVNSFGYRVIYHGYSLMSCQGNKYILLIFILITFMNGIRKQNSQKKTLLTQSYIN